MNLDIDLNLEECNKDTVEHANDNWEDDDCEKSLEPYKGMEFDSQDDAYSFYLKYSKFIGFGISKKSSRRSKISGEFIDVKIVCIRYGLKKEKDVSGTRHSQKVDCKAILHVKKNSNGKWYAHNFVKDHTHELFPAHAHHLPCHRSIDSSVKENIDTLHAVGVGTSKIYAAMAKKHGGYENIGFLEKDIRNHLDKERRDDGMKKTFKVQDFEKNVNFMVTWNVSHKEVACMCRKFESCGFLCRHVICVLQSLGIFYVPPVYILHIWTKNAKAFDSIKINSSGVQSKKQRFDELIHQATQLSEEASSSNETYNIAYRVLKEALEKCVTMNHSLKKFELYEACDVEEEDMDSNKLHDTSLHDPQISSTKGAPKRIKSGIEKSRKKKPNNKSRKVIKNAMLSKDGKKKCSQGHSNIANLPIDNYHDIEQDLHYTGHCDMLNHFSSQHSQYVGFHSNTQVTEDGSNMMIFKNTTQFIKPSNH
ncbi:hypothetical protein EZV62_021932 [Acer yangbiense]|uniref:Protein FAR1-RELATED SEQUENCE n=1 Tax=Acer yangbiense TaxID=1000413 RepID=A0A5C7H6Q9_9ROSI|nr:hypothetical protein EZV62_021932 [Acer yangbiense]